ncbi:helix-turn-helix domain-containing protein, partial [Acinetobacter baumannii]|uniref:helix-turn-helix domain-containing protein n=1 Tax=Acinetobacter baumannii TaxID=470 RepID=UPI0010FD1B8F
MAKVSISEAARLAGISRPTIYKLINSGQLNFTSVVKAGKTVKNIDTSELIRVFGTIANLPAAKDFTVNSEQEITQVNTPDLQHLQHKIE